jgi:hypothetical protein
MFCSYGKSRFENSIFRGITDVLKVIHRTSKLIRKPWRDNPFVKSGRHQGFQDYVTFLMFDEWRNVHGIDIIIIAG